MDAFNTQRSLAVAPDCLARLKLDLNGLCVLTDNGNVYAFTPVLATLAGAKVLVVGRDSYLDALMGNKLYIQQLLELSGATGSIGENFR